MTLGEEFAKALIDAGREIDAERFVACVDGGGYIIVPKADYDEFPALREVCDAFRARGVEIHVDRYLTERGTMYAFNPKPFLDSVFDTFAPTLKPTFDPKMINFPRRF